ncbi:MAG: RnfABCDGE type electron transport complex subunit D [Clostridiales bacterium]|nr:RnfABCDGE type electron transport complex subunit D [Clostridiales bacterium]
MIKTVSASPHITKPHNTTRRIMIDVLIALAPCFIAAVVFYGYHVVINLVVCLVFCFGTELLYGLIMSRQFTKDGVKKSSVWDLSFAVTALILTLNLPAVMPVKMWGMNALNADGAIVFSFDTVVLCALGSIFAIALVKMLFGGLGKNFANPACTGRVFLFIAFGTAGAFNLTSSLWAGDMATTGATWLGTKSGVSGSMLLDMFLGNTATAAVGETCVIAILCGYVYLSVRRVIDPRVPLMIIGSLALFVFLFDVIPSGAKGAEMFYEVLAHVMSGGLLFGSVFMATDYATSPNTFMGNVIYAVGIGLITALIRAFGSFPEGFSFALLIMNIVVPLLDKYIVPKPFGYVKPVKEKRKKADNGEKADGGVKA